jgi:hypothetical protein
MVFVCYTLQLRAISRVRLRKVCVWLNFIPTHNARASHRWGDEHLIASGCKYYMTKLIRMDTMMKLIREGKDEE